MNGLSSKQSAACSLQLKTENRLCNGMHVEGDGVMNVRVYIDGCFDIVHHGHANAIRQAKKMGHTLVAGAHSDYDITVNKGPPVFTSEERCRIIGSIKWVDEVVPESAYFVTPQILDKYGCDFIVHGDDIVSGVDGSDSYRFTKDAGRYRYCLRTPGISTTDLIDRILLHTSGHHRDDVDEHCEILQLLLGPADGRSSSTVITRYVGPSQLLSSTRTSSGTGPRKGDRIVYVRGAFDLLHIGHVHLLEKARAEGDYLIVGLLSDSVINQYKGENRPIMNLQERLMMLITNKYVSEVLIGAPYSVSDELIKYFNIDVICHGQMDIDRDHNTDSHPYQAANDQGKVKIIENETDVTTTKIIQRISKNRTEYEERNLKKQAAAIVEN